MDIFYWAYTATRRTKCWVWQSNGFRFKHFLSKFFKANSANRISFIWKPLSIKTAAVLSWAHFTFSLTSCTHHYIVNVRLSKFEQLPSWNRLIKYDIFLNLASLAFPFYWVIRITSKHLLGCEILPVQRFVPKMKSLH